MKKTTFQKCLAALLLFCFTNPFSHAQSSYDSHEFLLVFEDGTSQTYIDDLIAEFNSIEIWETPLSEVHLCRVSSFPFTITEAGFTITITDINEVVDRTQNRSKVDGSGLNYSTNTPIRPNPNQLGSRCPDPFPTLTINGSHTVRIGIFDTGVASNINDKALYSIGPYTGKDYVNDDNDPEDDHGHGTHVTGVISSISTNFSNTVTYNPLFEYDIRKTHNHEGEGWLSDVILALDESISEGHIHLANFSFSYSALPSHNLTPMEQAILTAEEHGVLIITSAGNQTTDNDLSDYKVYPASFDYDNIISVASVDCHNQLSQFSNWGATTIDIAAQGEKVVGPDRNNGDDFLSGTSQAAAIITGITSSLATNEHTFDYSRLKCLIMESVYTLPDLNQKVVSRGMINAYAAQQLLNTTSACPAAIDPNPSLGSGYQINQGEIETAPSSASQDWQVTPNPCDTHFYLTKESESAQRATIRIWDLQGRTIYSQQATLDIGFNQIRIERTPDLIPGIWIIQIETGANTETIKLFTK